MSATPTAIEGELLPARSKYDNTVRLNRRRQEVVRDSIRCKMIVNRLQGHVLGRIVMTDSQIRAAEILLRKCVPDLHRSELSGPGGGSIPIAALTADTPQDATTTYLAMLARPEEKPRAEDDDEGAI